MKLFIDGYLKEVFSLAANIKFCKNLQIKVYTPKIEIEGMDLYLLQNLIKTEDGKTHIPNINLKTDFEKIGNMVRYKVDPVEFNNNSWIVSTTDPEEALNWCDCYANFNVIGWELLNARDYNSTAAYLTETMNRLNRAKELGKKIYLPCDYKPYDAEANYDNMFNVKLDTDRLNHMKDLANDIINCQSSETDVKLVVGTTSASGKFSACLRMKEFYETHYNERTGIIFTENICDLLNSDYIENNKLDESLIINASKEWCSLSLDDYILYIQYAVAYLEARGCKHILLQGQGTYGLFPLNRYYIFDKKPLNVIYTILEHAIGCKTVAIATNVNEDHRLFNYFTYFRQNNLKITDVYLGSLDITKEFDQKYLDIYGKKMHIKEVYPYTDFIDGVNAIFSMDPDINLYTNEINNQAILEKTFVRNTKYYSYLLDAVVDNSLSSYAKFKSEFEESPEIWNNKIEDYIKNLEKLKYTK